MSLRNNITATAPAKTILFGEHFVVYDNPCILASINKRLSVNVRLNDINKIRIFSTLGNKIYNIDSILESSIVNFDPIVNCINHVFSKNDQYVGIDLSINSDFPTGMGLGSSAACCVATIAAVDYLFREIDLEWICEKSINAEKIIHTASSGADCAISTYGGIIRYKKGESFTKINPKNNFCFLIVETGIKHSTGYMVDVFRKFRNSDIKVFDRLRFEAEQICDQAISALLSQDLQEIGLLFNKNHKILKQTGVSHPLADRLVDFCLKSGAYGAKMTGAGGGGSVIVIADRSNLLSLCKSIGNMGFSYILTRNDNSGVVVNNN
jgi:mevalonate kinase